ncbi:outer membrane lipoprotein-sorting protein [Chitinimonas arctica]|nr:outer membrane lipoprotein-sorting protein [Chitinimonas arctica]
MASYRIYSLALALGLCATASAAPDAPPLAQWIKQAETILRGDTSAAIMNMKIKKEAYQRDYDLMVLTDDRSASNKVLIKMLGPALWRGNATVKVDDKISFYDPRNSRVTVMGSSMLGDSWMGSHFSNDDLMRETDLSRHYEYELLQQQAGQEEGLGAVKRYTVKLSPKPTAPVAWGKVIYQLYLDNQQQAYPRQLDYFQRADDAQAARSLVYSELKAMDGKTVPTRLTMRVPAKAGEFTEIEYRKLKFNVKVSADNFGERALQ